jgi:aerobic-type carbon monoxide dehydrogenase small subunit (CoxS/CutS family)/carbon monoxide dehydrogenase subunit G
VSTALALTVNGQIRTLQVEPRTHLADALRENLNLTGTHLGCEQGVCGACTVLIDGIPQRSCIAYALACEGSRITTIEGFNDDPTMAALREAFAVRHALQCGFCTPGMLITARDIVLRLGDVPDARIREELAGNLCRCTGYVGIVDAVRDVAAGRAPGPAASAASAAALAERPAAEVAAVAPSPLPANVTAPGGAALEERLRLAAAPDPAWAALSDLRRVAACLPGAQLETLDGDRVAGRVAMALGPVKVSFAGEGQVVLNAAARSGRLVGGGRDGSSRAEGEVIWSVIPDGSGGSELVVRLSWRLTGPLAQFGRAGLVQDLVRRLAQTFARNLDAMVAGEAPPPARAVGVFALLWGLLKSRLFGRRS